MDKRDETAEEQDRVLRELAELGLAFARELKARIATVNAVAEAEGLALAFHRVARSVRLAVALQSRLARERHEVIKLDRALGVRRTDRRKAQIKAVLAHEIFTDEAEEDAADALYERLTERLDDDALFDAFLDGPVEQAIARIREDLGLTGPPPIPPPLGAADEVRGAGSQSDPVGEVDRAQGRETEGVAAHLHLHNLQTPHRPAAGAPPEGEQLDITVPPPGRSPVEGEVDRAKRETEGVAARSDRHSLHPPHPAPPGAPPEGEQLEAAGFKTAPS